MHGRDSVFTFLYALVVLYGALLLDDPAAELDAANLGRLLEVVRELRVQLFVTALRPDLPGLGTPGALFHVEQGRVEVAG